jgi:hypothetical protein
MRHARMYLRIQPRPQPDRWQPGKLLVTCPLELFIDFSVSRSLFVCVCVGSSEKSERNADCDLFHDLSKNGFS